MQVFAKNLASVGLQLNDRPVKDIKVDTVTPVTAVAATPKPDGLSEAALGAVAQVAQSTGLSNARRENMLESIAQIDRDMSGRDRDALLSVISNIAKVSADMAQRNGEGFRPWTVEQAVNYIHNTALKAVNDIKAQVMNEMAAIQKDATARQNGVWLLV